MKKIFFIFVAIIISLTSCTQNSRIKFFGSSGTFYLPANQKLINVTWKESDLWYLTREMKPEETPETYYFSEKSQFGILEGTFIIKETK